MAHRNVLSAMQRHTKVPGTSDIMITSSYQQRKITCHKQPLAYWEQQSPLLLKNYLHVF